MLQRLLTVLAITVSINVSSCTKDDNGSQGLKYKEDTNNYFTATFNGKTLKTSGFLFTMNGVTNDFSQSVLSVNAFIVTRNTSNGVETDGQIAVSGSTLNLAFGDLYKIPVQQLDAAITIERVGNAVGSYKILESSIPGYYTSHITDVTVGRKKYDLEPASTVLNITSADAQFIQGTYTGRLIDGSTKIPVTGTFKLRKI